MQTGAPRAERGPGDSSMWRNCGFVKTKIDGENAFCLVRKMMWSPKKIDLLRNFNGFPVPNQVISKKKRSSLKLQWFFRPKSSCLPATSMGLSLLNVIWIHGSPKLHEPRGHCPPCPPLVGPACKWNGVFYSCCAILILLTSIYSRLHILTAFSTVYVLFMFTFRFPFQKGLLFAQIKMKQVRKTPNHQAIYFTS